MTGHLPLLLALDGDGLLHRAHHGMAGAQDRDAAGRPTWALRGLVTSVAAAAARLRPDAVLVALDSRVDPVRRALHPGYKAHRPPREADLEEQLEAAPALLTQAGIGWCRREGYEGDDVLASASAQARRAGWRSIVVTSDRDCFALLDHTTQVLRVLHGGVDGAELVGPAELRQRYGVRPDQYRAYAALRGDVSDNLPGVPGIGVQLAARLLQRFGDLPGLWRALGDGRHAQVAEVVGEANAGRLAEPASRLRVELNLTLMRMQDDLAVPAPEQLRLPLDRARLVAALRARGIGLDGCLWALVGQPPPPWTPNGFDAVPRHLQGAAATPWAQAAQEFAERYATHPPEVVQEPAPGRTAPPGPGRRPRPVPVQGQLTLF